MRFREVLLASQGFFLLFCVVYLYGNLLSQNSWLCFPLHLWSGIFLSLPIHPHYVQFWPLPSEPFSMGLTLGGIPWVNFQHPQGLNGSGPFSPSCHGPLAASCYWSEQNPLSFDAVLKMAVLSREHLLTIWGLLVLTSISSWFIAS